MSCNVLWYAENGNITEANVVIEDYANFRMFNDDFPLPDYVIKSNDKVVW